MFRVYRRFVRRSIALLLLVAALLFSGSVSSSRAAPSALRPVVYLPLVAGPGSAAAPALYGYNILRTYPHDPGAFTEGLYWDNGYLYESTGEIGTSGVRKVALGTGQVVQSVAIGSAYFGEGIATVGNKIYELTWKTHLGFIYDKSTLTQIGTFNYPTEGWGMTADGTHLIMSDGTPTIHFMDPNTLADTRTIYVTDQGSPVKNLNELEYINGEIWANVWLTETVLRISLQTGQVMGKIDMTGLRALQGVTNPDAVLNGIAWDPSTGGHLYMTGKLWPNLYEIQLIPR